jgi:hypothetical protein
MPQRAKNSALVLILFAVLLSGCSQVPAGKAASTPAPAPTISAAQAAALADGKITYAEYEAGWRRYVACDAKAGYTVVKGGETNEVISGQVPDAAVTSGADAQCYDREFKQIDMIWQVSRENTSPQAVIFHKCLVAKGKTPAATYAGMVKQLQSLGIDPASCN